MKQYIFLGYQYLIIQINIITILDLYCFSRNSLKIFKDRKVGIIESCEKVEMNGMIELGIKVKKMVEMEETFTVDIPSDIDKVESYLDKFIIEVKQYFLKIILIY